MQTRHRINWAEIVLILIISIAVVGCLKKTEPPIPTEETASNEEVVEEKVVVEEGCIAVPESAKDFEEQGYTAVEVFFATDRNQLQPGETPKYFGVERSDLKYGVCSVSIPRDHRMGELEAPGRFLFWRLKEDPQYHIVTLNAVVLPSDIYFDHLQSQIMNCDQKSALIFFHGFNVTFDDAARRTAQMAYDLGFKGAPVFYSWPSQGKVALYTVDEQTIEWSQANMRRFLEDFFEKSDAENVYLIGHSMGTRGLTRALIEILREKPEIKSRLKEIILAAPDIDADVFKRDIAPQIISHGENLTLYTSADDKALDASRIVHKAPRAGSSKFGVTIVPGMETIDATGQDTGFLGHSYIGDIHSLLADIYALMVNEHRAPERFGLKCIKCSEGRYWKFKE